MLHFTLLHLHLHCTALHCMNFAHTFPCIYATLCYKIDGMSVISDDSELKLKQLEIENYS